MTGPLEFSDKSTEIDAKSHKFSTLPYATYAGRPQLFVLIFCHELQMDTMIQDMRYLRCIHSAIGWRDMAAVTAGLLHIYTF